MKKRTNRAKNARRSDVAHHAKTASKKAANILEEGVKNIKKTLNLDGR